MDRELEFALIAGKSALILAADAAGPDSIAGDRCRKSATVIQGHIDALSTPPAPDAVKRYDISLTAGEVHECRTGFWMHASGYDALARQVARSQELKKCALEAAESFLIEEQTLEQEAIDEWKRLYPKFPWKEDHKAIERFHRRQALIERIKAALAGDPP